MDVTMLFEVDPVDGTPMPRWPYRHNRPDLEPDGQVIFSLQQAAQRWQRTPESLRARWLSCFAGDLPQTDGPVGDEPKPDTAGTGASARGAAAPDVATPPLDFASALDARAAQRRRRQEAVRRHRYPGLSDEQWEYVQARCSALRLSLESELVFAKTIHNPEKGLPDVFVGLRRDGHRVRALETGELAGIDKAVFEYADDEAIPEVAIVTVRRRFADGRESAFTAEACWREYYGDAGDDDLARRMPRVCLAARAEVAALRMAFADVLHGVYSEDELELMERRAARAEAGGFATDDEWRPHHRPAGGGMNFDTFCQQLERLGFTGNRRADLIRQMRERFPVLANQGAMLYRKILDEVRSKPEVYGAVAG